MNKKQSFDWIKTSWRSHMNLVDIIILLIVLVLSIIAIRASRKEKCNGNCGSCASGCATPKQPDFVRRYREDHPQQNDHSNAE